MEVIFAGNLKEPRLVGKPSEIADFVSLNDKIGSPMAIEKGLDLPFIGCSNFFGLEWHRTTKCRQIQIFFETKCSIFFQNSTTSDFGKKE
jgi:hypothetical protein